MTARLPKKIMKDKKKGQGAPLPPDGSQLETYPVGSCVRVGGAWHLIAFRVGPGAAFLRALSTDPRSDGWLVGMGPAVETRSGVASESCWPWRRTDVGDSDEVDPLALGDLAAREAARAREGVL